MHKYKIIFFDIDGTLYSHAQQKIPSSCVHAIKKLKENGYIIALCSGRSLLLLDQLKIREYIDADYMVLINGSLVIDKNLNEIYKCPINTNTMEKFVNKVKEIQGELAIITKDDLFRLGDNLELINKGYIPLHIDIPPKKDFINKEVYQCNLFIEDYQINEFKELENELNFIHLLDYGYDVLAKDESKTKGIEKLINYLKIEKGECIAFGDGNNDVGMIEYVGLGIAMGNGVSQIKQKANYVTSSIDEDGIYNALKHFNLI